ncbi:cytochrome c biogenesis CcdA family protein [Clostridium sp. MSJ-4]|uniref:Cytochrome c biogenesis CcdA family protein n=1 Tax=Clostridium simiarum TaxID=2841506 RepID=A0ABS6F0X8_9CLOT|nr:cytochrome c biogenesis CcdA family protein [Clostridium simiarum]MBU5592157.1 cytochrome c biogenesis CcdA family protein [Clostridium simiarum]
MSSLLSNFTEIINNNIWLALVMSLFAGLASSFSPCVLSSVPLIVGYVEGNGVKDKKVAFKYSMFFGLGVIATFTIIGALSAVLGRFFSGAGKLWYIVLAAVMILSGLQLLGILTFGRSQNSCKMPTKRRGLFGAFMLGILGGALSSPCATPVLAAILTFVAGKANVLLGIAMLLLYSVGHCALIILAGTSVGVVEHLSSSEKTLKFGKILKLVLGAIIIILGLYMFSLGI